MALSFLRGLRLAALDISLPLLLGGEDVVVIKEDALELDDALEVLREGNGNGGSTGGRAEEAVEDSDPDRDRSEAARWLCGVPGLLSLVVTAAEAFALSRMDASSCLLLSPGGIARTEASMRFCGGERLDSLLAGGVMRGVGCGKGTVLGTLFSAGGLYVVAGSR